MDGKKMPIDIEHYVLGDVDAQKVARAKEIKNGTKEKMASGVKNDTKQDEDVRRATLRAESARALAEDRRQRIEAAGRYKVGDAVRYRNSTFMVVGVDLKDGMLYLALNLHGAPKFTVGALANSLRPIKNKSRSKPETKDSPQE